MIPYLQLQPNTMPQRVRDWTKTYSTTEKATFWCNYMTALKGPLCVQDQPHKPEPVSIWSVVSSSDITLYDVLYGKKDHRTKRLYKSMLSGVDEKASPTAKDETSQAQEVIPYSPMHTTIYGAGRSRTARIS